MIRGRVYLVVALPAEARPLISAFRLRRTSPGGRFPIYASDYSYLTISGVGKKACVAATQNLHTFGGSSENALWINLGIAGHAHYPLGEARLANRVTDAVSGYSWEPKIPSKPPLPTEALVTLDEPDLDYCRSEMIDMEASGFLSVAWNSTTPDRVHCIKVISDNKNSPARGINGKRVSELISLQQEPLLQLMDQLSEPETNL